MTVMSKNRIRKSSSPRCVGIDGFMKCWDGKKNVRPTSPRVSCLPSNLLRSYWTGFKRSGKTLSKIFAHARVASQTSQMEAVACDESFCQSSWVLISLL